MEELKELLQLHLQRYPEARPEDFVKLLYQNEFGPEHAITEAEFSLSAIMREYYETEAKEEDLFVPIGNYLVRLNIHVAAKQYAFEDINDWFIRTAQTHRGSMTEFLKKLKYFDKSYDQFDYHFTEKELKEFLSIYRSQAYPAIHHSETYRNLYQPHYRVIRMNLWK